MLKQLRQAIIKIGIVAFGFLISANVWAASVPNTFAAGTPATAAEVNANFQALVNAANALEGTAFTGYNLTASPTGVLGSRTVVVYDRGNGCFIGRGLFTNTTGVTVETPSGTVTPALIFVWQGLCGDNINITSEVEYVYGFPAAADGSADWENALGISINQDATGDGVWDATGNFNYAFDETVAVLPNMEIISGGDHYLSATNEILVGVNWSYLRSLYPRTLQVNGLIFNDVVIDRFIGISKIRYRAQGIGTVLELTGSMSTDPLFNNGAQQQRAAIFYRQSNGTTGGSAVGTPYANGATGSINKWFTQ